MSTHLVAHNRFGPDTYEVSAAVKGGAFVAPSSGGKVATAAADSITVLGVALYGALPAGTSQSSTTGYDEPAYDFSTPGEYVAVAWTGTYKLVSDDILAFGDYVVVGTNGNVKKAAAAALGDNRKIVGKCVEPLGVAAAAKGLIRLSL